MITEMSKNWWLFLVRGLAAVAFGVLAIVWPAPAWMALVLLFGTYALIDGTFTLITGIELRPLFSHWWAAALEGVVGIIIGMVTFIWPNPAAHVLFYLIATWAVVTGILEIVAAIRFRFLIPGEWSMILAGVLSILFGAMLFVFPSAGLVGMVWTIGVYAIAFGITQFVFASRLHDLNKRIKASTAAIR
jgi:uncharacterized membrane protein HdeD (DUF308 family)